MKSSYKNRNRLFFILSSCLLFVALLILNYAFHKISQRQKTPFLLNANVRLLEKDNQKNSSAFRRVFFKSIKILL